MKQPVFQDDAAADEGEEEEELPPPTEDTVCGAVAYVGHPAALIDYGGT